MVRFLIGAFFVLHGLVHMWYVVLSQGLVEFEVEMGWTGESWLMTRLLGDAATRSVASVLYALSTVGFVAGGIGMLARQGWWRPVAVASAALSGATVILLWDGGLDSIVQKGLAGLLIDVGILAVLLVLR
jgi:hypothetical protein